LDLSSYFYTYYVHSVMIIQYNCQAEANEQCSVCRSEVHSSESQSLLTHN
jgi:hypothetical protein